jgi:hypothetical protein
MPSLIFCAVFLCLSLQVKSCCCLVNAQGVNMLRLHLSKENSLFLLSTHCSPSCYVLHVSKKMQEPKSACIHALDACMLVS